jgi:hypothetical protein
MGLAETFEQIKWIDENQARVLIESALDEDDARVQRYAILAMFDERLRSNVDLIFSYFGHLKTEVRELIPPRRWMLIPVARKLLGSEDENKRVSVFEVLNLISDIDIAEILIGGLDDSNIYIKDKALEGLEKIGINYKEKLLAYQLRREEQAKIFIEENKKIMLGILAQLIKRYSTHMKKLFVEIALLHGRDAYNIVEEVILAGADNPVYSVIKKEMLYLNTNGIAELLLQFSANVNEKLARFSNDIQRKKENPEFLMMIANYLEGLSPDEFTNLASRTKEIMWINLLKSVEGIEIRAAQHLARFILKSGVSNLKKAEMYLELVNARASFVRIEALYGLKELEYAGPSGDMIGICETALQDHDPNFVIAAIDILSQLKPENIIRILLPLASSNDDRIRRRVMKEISSGSFEKYMESFYKIDPKTRELAGKALSKLHPNMVDRLSDEIASLEPQRRLKALRIIEFTGEVNVPAPLVMELINDTDTNVRATAVKIIGLFGNRDAIKILISALDDPDERVRANAIEAFEKIGDPVFSSILLPFVKDPDNRIRANAVKALWRLGVKEVKNVLEDMLEDSDEDMRLSAVWAIGQIRYDGSRDVLVKAISREKSRKVREKITGILATFSK